MSRLRAAGLERTRRRKRWRARRERWASWSLDCIKILPLSHTHAHTLSSGNLARVTWDFGAEGSGPRIIICSQARITGPPGVPGGLGPVSQHSRPIPLTLHPDSLTDRHSPRTPAEIASLLHFSSAQCHVCFNIANIFLCCLLSRVKSENNFYFS